MKVSIALATYNGAKFLAEQLLSIMGQTRPPDELVISDDGSTDKTLSIVSDFARSCKCDLRVFKNDTRMGYAKNFESALQQCRGEIIFLCDQDDYWLPVKVERMLEIAERAAHAAVFVNNAEIVDECLNPMKRTLFETRGRRNLANVKLGCCMAVRREFLGEIMPIPDEHIGHDGWIAGIADGLGVKIVHDEVLQLWRRHEAATSPYRLANGLRYKCELARKWYTNEQIVLYAHRNRFYRQALRRLCKKGIKTAFWSQKKAFEARLRDDAILIRFRMRMRKQRRLARVPMISEAFRHGCYNGKRGIGQAIVDMLAKKER